MAVQTAAEAQAPRSLIGNVGYYGPLTLLFVLLGVLLQQKEYWLLPFVLLWQVFNYYLNVVLKNTVQHARPSGPLPTPAMGYFEKHKYYGFPSGHAQMVVSLGVFMLLWLNFTLTSPTSWFWCLALLLVAQMLITLWQRVCYLRHTVWQVIAGSVLGGLVGMGFFYMVMVACLKKL
jgi:membrane-associated phospholipid phosphatase